MTNAEIKELALAAIANNALFATGTSAPLSDVLETVKRLCTTALDDVASIDGPLTRHHLYEPLGNTTLHVLYERVGRLATIAFYAADSSFEAESLTPVDLSFIGSFPVMDDYVN